MTFTDLQGNEIDLLPQAEAEEPIITYPDDRVALFIDGPNLYSSARGLRFDLDYARILRFFRERSKLIRAFYYTALPDSREEQHIPIKPLVDFLGYNGYSVVTKSTKQYEDPYGNKRTKGNMDIELAIDMLKSAAHLDHAVLFSGDGDFRRLVEAVQSEGVRVTVISTVRTSPPMCADDLRRQATTYVDLQDLKAEFERERRNYSAAGEEPSNQ